MATYQEDTAITERDGKLIAHLSSDWEIWGPNGGYVSAIALRAAGMRAPEGHRPASISIQYLRTAKFEPVEAHVEVLKSGQSAACLHVRLVQDSRPFLTAQVWTTNKSDGHSIQDIATPDIPNPDELKSMWELLPLNTPKHNFWAHFDTHPVGFIPNDVRSPEGHVRRDWIRYHDWTSTDDVFLDSGRCLVLADTLPWTAFCRGVTGHVDFIAPSLDISIWFHRPPKTAEWLFTDVRTEFAHAGLMHAHVTVWNEERELLATAATQMLQLDRK